MKFRVLFFIALCTLVFACKKDSKQNELNLIVKVNGLRQGKLIILKEDDNSFKKVDSMLVEGEAEVETMIKLDSPELFYLVVERNNSYSIDNLIPFFAEPKTISIETDLDSFSSKAIIKGSKNQDSYSEFKNIMKQFGSQELSLIQESILNKEKINTNNKAIQNIQLKKYLYTVNFAFTNRDLEIAPYIALTAFDLNNHKITDSLYNVLSTNARNCVYGKKLHELVKK